MKEKLAGNNTSNLARVKIYRGEKDFFEIGDQPSPLAAEDINISKTAIRK